MRAARSSTTAWWRAWPTQHFYVSTTTGDAAAIYRELQRRVAEWRLDCGAAQPHRPHGGDEPGRPALRAPCSPRSPTSRWMTRRSPTSRCARATSRASAARIAARGLRRRTRLRDPRAGGPARAGLGCADRGRAPTSGSRPFGVEAQRVLRLEKGHVIVGQDTDGVTNPSRSGPGRMVKEDKPFFVGQRSLAALRRRGTRQQLIGFTLDGCRRADARVPSGHPCGRHRRSRHQRRALGHAGPHHRPCLCARRHWPPSARGSRSATTTGCCMPPKSVPTPFYDPKHERQKLGRRWHERTCAVTASLPPAARLGLKGRMRRHCCSRRASPSRAAPTASLTPGRWAPASVRCLRLGNTEFLLEQDEGDAAIGAVRTLARTAGFAPTP